MAHKFLDCTQILTSLIPSCSRKMAERVSSELRFYCSVQKTIDLTGDACGSLITPQSTFFGHSPLMQSIENVWMKRNKALFIPFSDQMQCHGIVADVFTNKSCDFHATTTSKTAQQ